MKQILITTPSLRRHDAISNDIFLSKKYLEVEGYIVSIFSEHIGKDLLSDVVTYEKISALTKNKDNILIYHHSIYWKLGETLLNNAECKIIFRYHNITPANFFEPYDSYISSEIKKGLEQTKKFATNSKILKFANASNFNSLDLIRFGADKSKNLTIPPFNLLDKKFKEKQTSTTEKNSKKNIQLLIVGRLTPHKGILHAFKIIDKYIEFFGSNIQLNMIGITFESHKFLIELQNEINKLKISGNVKFVGETDQDELERYFREADCYLAISEHEGFCVPIIEAQYFRTPVIAVSNGAIAETIGENQIVFNDFDYDKIATVIHLLCTKQEFKEFIIENGAKNLERFQTKKIVQKTLDLIQEVDSL